MPASMMHLLAAHVLKPHAPALFWAGSLAPDAVPWPEKDRTHFRDAPDREQVLRSLAARTDPADQFAEAVLMHFWLDRAWDEGPFAEFISAHGEDWFRLYRAELSRVSAHLFRSLDWSGRVFREALACPEEAYGETPGAVRGQVREFIGRTHEWHKAAEFDPPLYFSPGFCEEFCRRGADGYKGWRELG